MILKASQRAGAGALAAHLLNERDNEHVRVHELRGFVADDLGGALREAQAIAKGTKCRQFMFSLSLNPPQGAAVGEADFEKAADRAERALGLEGLPRALVIHEKEGRMHAHVVWSRIDAGSMTAINLSHFKRKLSALSRDLFLEHGWSLPDGLKMGGGKSPLNFTLAEWQQAKRLGRDPREIKTVFREAWERSDTLASLGNALAERGYFLAGGKRGFVAVDTDGVIYSLAKWAGIKVREARAKHGEAATLPNVADVQATVAKLVSAKLKAFAADTKVKHEKQVSPLQGEIRQMQNAHKAERELLLKRQSERWQAETQERAERMRAGLRGLWDNITGRARAIRAINEAEAIKGVRRDRAQRDALVLAQLKDRAPLQARVQSLRARHAQERKALAQEIVRHMRARVARLDAEPPSLSRRPRRRDRALER